MDTFTALDADRDDRITLKEYNAGFDILDADKNDLVTRKEFDMSSAAPFDVIDKDGDQGSLSSLIG